MKGTSKSGYTGELYRSIRETYGDRGWWSSRLTLIVGIAVIVIVISIFTGDEKNKTIAIVFGSIAAFAILMLVLAGAFTMKNKKQRGEAKRKRGKETKAETWKNREYDSKMRGVLPSWGEKGWEIPGVDLEKFR